MKKEKKHNVRHIEKPYKIGTAYVFVFLPHFLSNMPVKTLATVVDATALEIVVEYKNGRGITARMIIGRVAVKTAREVEVAA